MKSYRHSKEEASCRSVERYHRVGQVWPEVIESIKASGVLQMNIYRDGLSLIMVMDVDDDFTFERKATLDAENPKVQEWETLMERFQRVGEGVNEKWQPVNNIFKLSDH